MNRRKFITLAGAGVVSAAALIVVDRTTAARLTPGGTTANGGGQQSLPRAEDAPATRGGKTLIVYFSHRGANYPNLNLTVGNTQQVANFIRDRVTDADFYEVEPVVPYPSDYDEMDRMALEEAQNQTYREIKPGAPETDQYDTVFLGYPCWHAAQPMALQTFMRDRNLNGATIIPFTTHSGSGWGNSLEVIDQYYPSATVRDGYVKEGVDVYNNPDQTRSEVNDWLNGLGY